MTARAAGNAVGGVQSLPMREAVMGNQTMRQAARLAASQVHAKRRRERAQRDRRLEKLAIEVLSAADRSADPSAKRGGNAVKGSLTRAFFVGDTGFEPVTSSVSGKRAPTAPIARGGDGI
jgi:hypothetical protein